ncbi:MAG: UbiH/UbiF/VisC/COQ6 family ubiquinone biosynthesis hydroxylase [Pseudomonadota bacterium]
MERAEIVIIGGGLIGPAIALALTGGGLRPVLIDAQAVEVRKDPEFDGRAYAVTLASQRLLNRIGVWEDIAPNAQPISDIHVSEGGAPAPLLHFDPAELDEGAFGWIVEDRWLRNALLNQMQDADIPHYASMEVGGIERGTASAEIALPDGQVLHADLVIAADGRRSRLARSAGIRRIGWSYDQTGLVNAIAHTEPHDGVAHQSFFPGGPFAVLPLPGNRSSLVWSERREAASRLAGLEDEAFIAEVARRIGGRLGEISLIGRRWAYPLDLTLATRFVDHRLALIGDAAHGVHPIAGQGMNLGLRDVAALAETLADASRLGEDLGSLPVLERYQRWRRFDTTAMALGMDGLNRLFSNNNSALSAVRQAGLRVINGLATPRQTLMREAIGAQGTVPKLLKGRPL